MKSLKNEAGDHADKAGPYATNIVVYIYKKMKDSSKAAIAGASAAGVASHIAILAAASPELGALVAALAYIYMSKSGGDKK
jgi:hypothetical protein